jgi:hypothetical protein
LTFPGSNHLQAESYKTDPKPLLVSPNPESYKPSILGENKVLIKFKQALTTTKIIKIKPIS